MSMTETLALCALIVCTGAASADPLSGMVGDWSGAGWVRETPDAPQEAVRCRLQNTYDAAQARLSVSGRCAVPGRQIDLSGQITADRASDRITGRWSNPDGPGSVALNGVMRDDLIAFTFAAQDPVNGRNLAQNVEFRLTGDTLRLRASDRDRPDIAMSDITLTK
jgi:hypothetical protein